MVRHQYRDGYTVMSGHQHCGDFMRRGTGVAAVETFLDLFGDADTVTLFCGEGAGRDRFARRELKDLDARLILTSLDLAVPRSVEPTTALSRYR